MSGHDTKKCAIGAWEELTDSNASHLAMQHIEGSHVYIAGAVGQTAPTAIPPDA